MIDKCTAVYADYGSKLMPVQKGIIPSNLPGLLLCIADRFLGQNSETIVMGWLEIPYNLHLCQRFSKYQMKQFIQEARWFLPQIPHKKKHNSKCTKY